MTSVRTLLSAWNIKAKRQLGQNFLSDPAAAEMIVRRSGIGPQDTVVEIGAGLGALTIPAARAAQRVLAVETDRRLIGLLRTELLAHHVSNVDIVEQDVLRLDLNRFAGQGERGLVILGNLPYHISSQVLVWLIRSRQPVRRAVLMFQKELARRIIAGPGGKDYGRISVMVQYCADIRRLAELSAPLFFPRPKVDSEVLEIAFRHPPTREALDEATFFRLVKAAFSKRRKTLKNALSSSELGLSALDAVALLDRAAIDTSRRAETLSIDEYVRLADGYHMFSATDTVRSPSMFT